MRFNIDNDDIEKFLEITSKILFWACFIISIIVLTLLVIYCITNQ